MTKFLLVHTRYLERGGEDEVFDGERALLERRGHDVVAYLADNKEMAGLPAWKAAACLLWNHRVYRELRALIRRERPDLVYCYNLFPLLSPSVYYAARAEGVKVVQWLGNFRLLCPNALLLRRGRACRDCVGRAFAWPGIVHACYRSSRVQTMAVATMLALHRLIGTWHRAVDLFVAQSEFARGQLIQGALPAQRVMVKPNSVAPGGELLDVERSYVLFVGRLSEEKGVPVLLKATETLGGAVSLVMVGDGPLADTVAATAARLPYLRWVGRRDRAEVNQLMAKAQALVAPSLCFENFGMVVAEAYANALPVVVSDHGAMAELVIDGETGLLVPPGNSDTLAERLLWLCRHPEEARQMGLRAHQEYEARYSAEANATRLEEIVERLGHG